MWRRLVVVAILPWLLSACGTSGHPTDNGGSAATSSRQPTIGPVPTISVTSQVDLPLFSYYPTASEIVTLARNWDNAVDQCVGTPALSVTPQEESAIGSAVDSVRTFSSMYGFFDTSRYRQAGYEPVVSGFEISLSPSVQVAVDKCQAKLASSWGFDLRNLLSDPGGAFPSGGPPVPIHDSRYTRVVSAWSKCMRSKGFDYETPLAPLGSESRLNGTWPKSAEIATATADVDCKISTNLVGMAVAVEAAYQAEYIGENQSQLREYRVRLRRALAG
jgi:hypothetical protein